MHDACLLVCLLSRQLDCSLARLLDSLARPRSSSLVLARLQPTQVFPELRGKLNGLAVRVPLTNGSLTDCVFELNRETTVEEVNGALRAASEGELQGILGFETKPLVSTDYTDDPRSGIVDALSTQVIDGTMVKLYVWYDNEWGYSKRMAELALLVNNKFLGGPASIFGTAN